MVGKKVEELARGLAKAAAEALGGEEVPEGALEALEEELRGALTRFAAQVGFSEPRGELASLWASLMERTAVSPKELPRRFRQWVKQGFLTQPEYEAVLQLIRGEEPSFPPDIAPQEFLLKVSNLLLRFRSAKRR